MPASQQCRHDPRGSLWHRWNLHFHTPSSFDCENGSVGNEEIVEVLVSNGVEVVAITDHHKIDVKQVRALQKLSGDRLTEHSVNMMT
ncbi:hypothetical protein ACFLTZ_07325 [Chloroflexota bacterium]